MNINKKIQKEVEGYISSSNLYTFARFIKEHRLDDGAINRGFDILIKCPFQDRDDSPSCSCNDKMNAFHCFSCGASGNYVKFVMEYDAKVQGIHTNYYQKLNELLQDDPAMQSALNAQTIYVKESIYDTNVKHYIRPKIIKQKCPPGNYLELSSWMLKHHCTDEEKIYMILQMQKGISAIEIYKDLSGDNTDYIQKDEINTETKIDFSSILSINEEE